MTYTDVDRKKILRMYMVRDEPLSPHNYWLFHRMLELFDERDGAPRLPDESEPE